MTNLVINSQAISQHNDFYSLNDLHRVSGGENRHRPTFFFQNQETQEMIAELEKENTIAYHTKQGKQGGTYACRELVYRYAMWISPKFSLMVIRAFDAMNTGAIPCLEAPKLSDEQCYQIQKAIKQKCLYNGVHYQTIYNALYDKFKKKSYKDILATDFDEAMAFIESFEFAPALSLNIPFIQNVLADNAHQNRKAQDELSQMMAYFSGALDHLQELKHRLEISERCIMALQNRFIA